MVENGYKRDFAERTSKPPEAFDYAASFALIAYASSWSKCWHPDVFCYALVNAQPMGFYAIAQMVRDAREHDVQARPVCINASRWDCTLEPTGQEGSLAARLARGSPRVLAMPKRRDSFPAGSTGHHGLSGISASSGASPSKASARTRGHL